MNIHETPECWRMGVRMKTGLNDTLTLSDSVDDDGDMEISMHNDHDYIDKQQAIEIIEHLKKVFEIGE